MSPARIPAAALNPKLRAELGADGPKGGGSRPTGPRTAGDGCRWRCVPCGADSATWTAWEPLQRHVDSAHGGGRIELILEPEVGP